MIRSLHVFRSSRPRVDRDQKEADLMTTIEVWSHLDNPTAESDLMVESDLSESVLTMLRRGRDVARLAPERGINEATKSARNLARPSAKRFQRAAQEYEEAAQTHNLEVIRFRSVRKPRTRKRGRALLRIA